MKGPAARDDDSMAVLLRGIKTDIARLSARSTVPVGEGWRIEQRGPNLVAVLPGEDAEFVVASPGGECGKVLACLAGAMNGTLFYDDADRVAGVRISEDTGNGLRTGEDGGLFSRGGAGTSREPVVLSGPYKAPGVIIGNRWNGYDWEDIPGSWIVPPGTRDPDTYEYSNPYFDDDMFDGAGWNVGLWYDDKHADPRTGLSLRIPQISWTVPQHQYNTLSLSSTHFGWYLGKFGPDPHWCKDWCEISFTAYFTEWPNKFTDPRDNQQHSTGFYLMSFWPGGSLWINDNGEPEIRQGDVVREYAGPYVQQLWVQPDSVYGHIRHQDFVPLNTLLRFRAVFRRGGESALYIYYGDPSKPDDEYDDAWSFGPAINMDLTSGSSPEFTVGSLFGYQSLNREYPYWQGNPLDYIPPMRFPEYWISNIVIKIDPVDDPRKGTRAKQVSWGHVGGRVHRSGTDITGATVTISPVAPATGLTQTTKSKGGSFTFYSVQLGTWKITAADGISSASITRQVTQEWSDYDEDSNGGYWDTDWTIALP